MKKKPRLPKPIPPPEHLSPTSQALWRKVVKGFVIEADEALILRKTLEAADRNDQAREAIAKGGAVITDRFGQVKPSPWTSIERDSATTLMRGWKLLGFDKPPKPPKQPKSRFVR